MSEPIRTIGKYGVELTEYKGEFGLTATYESKDGKHYQQWGKRKVSKTEYAEKDTPIKVILGDRKTAIGVLQMLITELGGSQEPIGYPKQDDDVPF